MKSPEHECYLVTRQGRSLILSRLLSKKGEMVLHDRVALPRPKEMITRQSIKGMLAKEGKVGFFLASDAIVCRTFVAAFGSFSEALGCLTANNHTGNDARWTVETYHTLCELQTLYSSGLAQDFLTEPVAVGVLNS